MDVADGVTGALLHSASQALQGGDFLTGIYIGDVDGAVDFLVNSDDIAPEPPGAHRLHLFHGAPGLGPITARADFGRSTAPFGYHGGSAGVHTPAFGYGGGSGPVIAAAGATTVELDLDGDGSGDVRFLLDLADRGWSYAYVLPGPMLIHHVLGMETVAVLPTP